MWAMAGSGLEAGPWTPWPGGRSVDSLAWRLVRGAGWGETKKGEENEEKEREKEVEEMMPCKSPRSLIFDLRTSIFDLRTMLDL